MIKFKIYFLKLFKKLGILKFLNFRIEGLGKNYKLVIPINKGIGYPNLFEKNDCLNVIYEKMLGINEGFFIDVGANIGQTLLKVKQINDSIEYIGFEPNVTCCNYVKDLIKLNKFKYCSIENIALSDSKQIIELNRNTETDESASIVNNLRPSYFKNKDYVNTIPFDTYYNVDKISFIKIDVEGAELEVIRGMKNTITKLKPIILCEVLDSYNQTTLTFTQNRAIELCKILKEINYEIIQLIQENKRLKGYKCIDIITIVQWTERSYDLNDYIFFHVKDKQIIIDLLSMACN